jgi:predicted RNA-binding Zn ribbon-like protein
VDREDLLSGRTQPGGRQPAEGPLRLVQDFVNTLDRENEVEALDAPGLADWLARRGLPGAARPAGDAELRRALAAREALRSLLLANNGGDVDDSAQARLEEVAARARLRLVLGAGQPRLEPSVAGVDGALGTIVATAFAAMLDGSWNRLKACPRHVCGWAFYDRSPNNRATWCSMQVCGNRTKAGTYYERRTRAAAGPS